MYLVGTAAAAAAMMTDRESPVNLARQLAADSYLLKTTCRTLHMEEFVHTVVHRRRQKATSNQR